MLRKKKKSNLKMKILRMAVIYGDSSFQNGTPGARGGNKSE